MRGRNLSNILTATALAAATSILPAQNVAAQQPKPECETHAEKYVLTLGALELKALEERKDVEYIFLLPRVNEEYVRCMNDYMRIKIGEYYDVQYEGSGQLWKFTVTRKDPSKPRI